ncbi:Transcriptional regulator, MucR family [Sphingomonas paucimobilis]|nr:Transcriptional regulator, MucR family [Sphingomonas paucimobilis]
MADDNHDNVTALTVQLLSAFVSNNTVSSENLAELIRTTRAALTHEVAAPAEAAAIDYVPAVSVRKSLSSPDHILSLIDGKPYKTLKRHLAMHDLTDKEYRERYNLPASYPLVAPSYSEARRAVAQKLGLGRKSVSADTAESAPANVAAGTLPKDTSKAAPHKAAAKAHAAKASSPKSDRRKLSIAAPKSDTPNPSVNQAAEPTETAAVPKNAVRAKPVAKPKGGRKSKTLEEALKAAGNHLSADAAEPTTEG